MRFVCWLANATDDKTDWSVGSGRPRSESLQCTKYFDILLISLRISNNSLAVAPNRKNGHFPNSYVSYSLAYYHLSIMHDGYLTLC